MKNQTHLKQITNSLHDSLHQITWRLGTEILQHVPNSSPDDFNVFYEQLKNFGVRNYSKVSIALLSSRPPFSIMYAAFNQYVM